MSDRHEKRTCGCRGIHNQVCDECQGSPVHLHDYDPSCVESLVGECVLDRVEAKVGNVAAGRHPKWQRVEPGTVIPAGQPYRAEHQSVPHRAEEGVDPANHKVYDGSAYDWFIDSSWKPPLVLPTTPTWGIAVHLMHGPNVGRWHAEGDEFYDDSESCTFRAHNVVDFIPLTDEQVARIEAAR